MKTFSLFLLFLFLSEVVSKFLFDMVSRNVEICGELHGITINELSQLLNHSAVFSKDFNRKELCFLECVYRTSNLTDAKESIQEIGLVTIIQKRIPFHSANSLEIFSSNIMLLCNEICGAEEHCLKAVEKVECLEAMVRSNIGGNFPVACVAAATFKTWPTLPFPPKTYLYTFGFLNNSTTKLILEIDPLNISTKIGLLKFQTFFGLRHTGALNYETLSAMYSASYIEDIIRPRLRRYVLYRNKWKKNNITYEISKYSKSLPRKIVNEEISRAFKLWASMLPMNVTFVKPGQGDIDIRFEKFNHGDVPFDGPGSVLAHTFYPITFLNGVQKSFIHFDDDENWTVNSTKGVDLFQTALHEIGHSLGLKHSTVEDSVMWPGHVGYKPNFTLGEDDIRGVQSLYGMNIKRNGKFTVQ